MHTGYSTTLKRRARSMAAFATAAISTACPACADDRLPLEARLSDAPALAVAASHGPFDTLAQSYLDVALALRAGPAIEGGTKILASELRLKGEPQTRLIANDAVPITPSLSLTRSFRFPLNSQGTVAQSTYALCAGPAKSSGRGTLNTAVIWRVSTGRFNYRYVQANLAADAASAAALLANPDFYGDVETQEIEIPVSIDVTCKGAAIASPDAPGKTPPFQPSQASEPRAAAEAKPALGSSPPKHRITYANDAAARADEQVSDPVRLSSANHAELPRCEGGMLRASGPADYLCLCPGNTRRVATGPQAFACEKRSAARF